MKHELFRVEGRIEEIQLRNRKVDSFLESEERGWGLRVFGKGVGFASGTGEVDWSRAKKLAELNRRPEVELPSDCEKGKVKVFDPELEREFLDDFAESFVSMAGEASVVPTFSKVRIYTLKTHLSNSEGLDVEKKEKLFRFETSLKVGRGSDVGEVFVVKWSRKRVGDGEIKKILKGAERTLGARPPSPSVGEVVFSPQLVCDLLWPVIGFHSSGEALHTGKTAFGEGEVVADEKLTLLDDGLYPFGILSSPFDGEGVACEKRKLVERGIFRERINDLLYGELTGLGSSGNASRWPRLGGPDNSYQVPPSLAGRNLVVESGKKSLDEILEEVGEGVFVEECSWLNPDEMSGGFGSEIRRGFTIEGGELGRPIKGGNVSGNVLEIIKKVAAVGREAEVASGHTLAAVAPHVCFDGVTVSA